jgi:hypothetical protein
MFEEGDIPYGLLSLENLLVLVDAVYLLGIGFGDKDAITGQSDLSFGAVLYRGTDAAIDIYVASLWDCLF